MKIVVAMDGDGHFMASPLTDREKVSTIIEEIQDGDFLANMDGDDVAIFENPLCNSTQWTNFVKSIEQRGTLEIVEL
jgi:hypothetical protein